MTLSPEEWAEWVRRHEDQFIGLTADEARGVARDHGLQARAITPTMFKTSDLRIGRINLYLDDLNIVREVAGG